MTSFSEHLLLLGYRTTVALRGIDDNNKGENTTTFHFTGKVRHGTSAVWLINQEVILLVGLRRRNLFCHQINQRFFFSLLPAVLESNCARVRSLKSFPVFTVVKKFQSFVSFISSGVWNTSAGLEATFNSSNI